MKLYLKFVFYKAPTNNKECVLVSHLAFNQLDDLPSSFLLRKAKTSF